MGTTIIITPTIFHFSHAFIFPLAARRALGSVAMFPVLQWRWSYDELMSEIVPQLAYGGEGKK